MLGPAKSNLDELDLAVVEDASRSHITASSLALGPLRSAPARTPSARLGVDCFFSAYLRALGASVGANVAWSGRVCVNGFEHLEVGDDCTVGLDAIIEPVAFVRGGLRVGRISLGARVKLGVCSFVAPGTSLGDDCEAMIRAAPGDQRWEFLEDPRASGA